MKKFYTILLSLLFLTACQSAKDALTLKKKESGDEFLVEKKSPLVIPPDFGELPIPNDSKTNDLKNENNDIKVTTGNNEFNSYKIIKNSEPTSLEKSVLDKIQYFKC